MNIAYIGLGSNLGNREENIQTAVSLLSEHPHIDIQNISTLHQSKATGNTIQPDFLNGALQLSTWLTPKELLTETEAIEKKLGRQHKGDQSPRPIDLDILFYNDEIISTDTLTIPHPLLHERGFVLAPLKELCPDFIHPLFDQTIQSLYETVVGY
ncbi:2-amino-4-hydroxy-6-hydroxymethyldihydropteridine diphosphokinase [Candidatus Marinamargulisbacteria bacterium SCGC AG-439-L15]|nr:2-amino-4-hydroxy-6-hydroxymethyldihydropteridine diphosphokinase [Candidatus Marinamargulisbacteria bacterium SCGC AG-439-L15]